MLWWGNHWRDLGFLRNIVYILTSRIYDISPLLMSRKSDKIPSFFMLLFTLMLTLALMLILMLTLMLMMALVLRFIMILMLVLNFDQIFEADFGQSF